MSIFSGWEVGDLERLKAALTGSPQGVIMLAVFVLIFIALIYILVHIISHQISNFYLRISEEETDWDQEDDADGQEKNPPVSSGTDCALAGGRRDEYSTEEVHG